MEINHYTDPKNSPDIEKDLGKIRHYDIENITDFVYDPFTFNTGILIGDNSEVIGMGIIRVINEIKLVLDPGLSNFQKSLAIKKLMNAGVPLCQCNEVIAYITSGGKKYENLLKMHYNFSHEPGTLLRLFK